VQDYSILFSAAFAAALALGAALKLWLASRQIHHVARHRDTVPPDFVGTVGEAAHHKAADYTITKARAGLLEVALSTAVVLGWTLLGGLHVLNQALLAWLGPGMVQQLALLVSFALVGSLIEWPLGLYQTFVIEQRFGFNKMTWRLWLMDSLKGAVLGLLIGLPLAALVLWLMAAAGSLWWLWAWGVWTGFNLLLLLIYPSLIAPLFNRFEPLADETLTTRVNALMQRCGFQAKGLFVMDGSKRSGHANAYFTGFGASKRVVFFDTLLQRLQPGEVDAVLAHELGHFKHRHVIKRMLRLFAISLGGFALLGWLSTQVWFYTGLGVQPDLRAGAPNDALALLLLLLALPALSFFFTPLWAHGSRRDEFQADAYAVSHANGPDLRSALLKLYEDNASTLTPDPLFARFYYSHPPAVERLARLPR